MKRIKYAVPATAFTILFSSLTAFGQSRLDEHVAVDGRYLPEVKRAERLRSTLTPLEMKFGSDPIRAVFMGDPVDFAPSLMPLPPTVWRAGYPDRPRLGYVDASLGSWLTGRLLAGVRPVDKYNLKLGIRFDGSSTALYKPEDVLYRRRRLDGTLGVDLAARMSGNAIFNASAQYHLGWFNYDLLRTETDLLNPDFDGNPASPTQTVNDAAIRLGWTSDREAPFRWDAGASFRHFSYRSIPFSPLKPTRETTFRLHGGVDGDVGLGSNASDWGIDAEASVNSYGGDIHPGTNGLLTLTPAWNISRPLSDNDRAGLRWAARVGARVDFSFNHTSPCLMPVYEEGPYPIESERATERFGFLHIAPDCSFSVGTNVVGAWFRATGGVEQQTLASLNDLDPYATPVMTGSLPAYTPADLRLGVTVTPISGFAATLEGCWKTTRSIYAGGLWTAIVQVLSRIEEPWDFGPSTSSYYNLHGFSVRAAVEWKSLRWLEAGAEATWQPQHRATGFFNGYDRPEWTVSVNLSSRPWRGLKLELDWDLRAKRSATVSDALDYSASIPLNNLSDLSFGISYDFTSRLSAGVRLDNLLDRRTLLAPGFVSEGFAATAGLQFLF